MTDIVFYDGNSPVPKNGKMIAHASNIQIELEIESGERESINIKYSDIREISKTGEKSQIEFSGIDENSVDRLIIFCDQKIHNQIYSYWASSKQNPFVRIKSIFAGLSNFKKFALGLVLLPVVLLIILQILNKSYIILPISIDKELGSRIAENFLSKETVIKSKNAHTAVEKMAKKIIPKDSLYTYKVYILKKSEVNAFALPDGHILIFSGLINQTRSPEQLAGVLAHEIGHIESRHGIRQIIRVLGIGYLISSAVGAGIEGLEVPETISEIANILIYYKYSREFEKEADLTSIKLLRNAGMNPGGIIQFLETMDKGKHTPEFLNWINSHPDFNARVKYLKEAYEKIDISHSKKQFVMSNEEWLTLKSAVAAVK